MTLWRSICKSCKVSSKSFAGSTPLQTFTHTVWTLLAQQNRFLPVLNSKAANFVRSFSPYDFQPAFQPPVLFSLCCRVLISDSWQGSPKESTNPTTVSAQSLSQAYDEHPKGICRRILHAVPDALAASADLEKEQIFSFGKEEGYWEEELAIQN